MSKRYNQLDAERQVFLERAREASKLTLPMVIRDQGHTYATTYEVPYQSVGSRGISALSSNLLLSLFPAGVPFFRLLVSESDFEEFGEEADQIQSEVNDSLSNIERTVLEEIEGKNLRSTIFEALKNLLISGNSLVYVQEDGNIRNYTLEDYVVNRDVSGDVTDIIIKESISQRILKTLDIAESLPSDINDIDGEEGKDKDVDLYTCIELQEDGTYAVWQEIKGEKIPDTDEIYEKGDLPWLALRLTSVTGESYGRGYVEGIIGDLKSLEGLSKAIFEAAAISAKTIFFVNPGTTTRAKDVSEAANGDVINGDSNDVSVLNVGKGGDLTVALRAAEMIEQRLSFSFNLLDATLPTKGQTTAYEVSQIVNSLEKVLAGVYAMLSSEFMQPLVGLIIKRLEQEEKVPAIPEQVKLIISTGLTALGRSSDIERLMQFSQIGAQISPEGYAALVDQEKLMRDLEAAIGVDVLKSPQTLQAEQEAFRKQQEDEQQRILAEQALQNGAISPEQEQQ